MSIRQVAALAGVSPATVSRVFTSARCRRAGDPASGQGGGRRARLQPEPGCPVACPRPHREPRHRRARHRQLLLRRHRQGGPARGARERDMHSSSPGSNHRPDEEYRLARAIAAQVDGLLMITPGMPDERFEELTAITPVVVFNRELDGLPGDADPGRRRDGSGGRAPARVRAPRDRLSRGPEGVLERDASAGLPSGVRPAGGRRTRDRSRTTHASRPASGRATSSWPAGRPPWSPTTTRSRWA